MLHIHATKSSLGTIHIDDLYLLMSMICRCKVVSLHPNKTAARYYTSYAITTLTTCPTHSDSLYGSFMRFGCASTAMAYQQYHMCTTQPPPSSIPTQVSPSIKASFGFRGRYSYLIAAPESSHYHVFTLVAPSRKVTVKQSIYEQ